jgi:transcriptional regulator with XRE-family HTH domain
MPQREWKLWMRGLGGAIRRARALAGISQAELAHLAGVSQGAVSRLESARGLSTPLVGVLRVLAALRGPLVTVPRSELPQDLGLLLDLTASGSQGAATGLDAGLLALMESYRAMKPTQRALFLRVASATAEAILDARAASGRPGA